MIMMALIYFIPNKEKINNTKLFSTVSSTLKGKSAPSVLTEHCAGIIMSKTITLDPDLPLRLLFSDH